MGSLMPVHGGQRLQAHLAAQRRKIRQAPKSVTVGFHDAVAPLAARLEYGDRDSNLPERPAFRASKRASAEAFAQTMRQAGELTRDAAGRAGKAAAAAITASYLNYKGPGLSQWQTRRKEGTEGAGRELVGHRGPKLVGHISTEVDGQKVP